MDKMSIIVALKSIYKKDLQEIDRQIGDLTKIHNNYVLKIKKLEIREQRGA